MQPTSANQRVPTTLDRYLVLVTSLLGWFFAGCIMVLMLLAARPLTISLGITNEADVGRWFAWYTAAFLLGAAAGGFVFGWLGDHIGRAKAMGFSILTYSLITGATYWAQSPEQVLLLRFFACLGVGGVWPNAVALASEVWSEVSRPLLAGLFGTVANLGFILQSAIATAKDVTPESWRWVMLLAASPAVLGFVVLAFVPESPRWLAQKDLPDDAAARPRGRGEVFRPPLLWATLLGISLGMIPLLGNWGGANWVVPWADAVGGKDDPNLKAVVQILRSSGAALGSLFGGWLAAQFGRRSTYFAISLLSLLTSIYLFYFVTPLDPQFRYWVFAIGFFGTVYFGWLPLYLPELFPTRVRTTGTGITFNFGRIVAAAGVLATGEVVRQFGGDYARVGQATCLIYVLGMIVICFAPDTSQRQLAD